MNGTFKEKDLKLTAMYKDKVLHLQHVYPIMVYCLKFFK
jgi:predicted nucleic-acid-binding Zn-ribbon protein